ncbi:putative disease resistance RPP13-like protein 1 [Quercus robur]|uniref:putative disease resistance RPP13-like protein 1 n=1 Tax=Quercus robur TaxID=38942 RepID=UPI0021613468|nr:putative disease resistance RPP13-like protein 1 [Quercus robur]
MVSVSALAPLATALLGLIKVVDSVPVKEFFANDKELIDKLEIELLTADAVLSDAEEKQIANTKVKEWLNDLKYAAYDADDLLDEATTAGLKRKKEIEANFAKGKAKAATEELMKRFSTLNPFYNGVRDRLKKIIERLENLAKRRDLLNLKGSARVKPQPRRQTTSLLDESEVFGRDEDKEKLIELLLGGAAQENGIPVIAIVGIPGVGKTTLAQLLYNDSRVEEHFSGGKAWVHVSEELDVFKVTRTIFESVDSKNCHFTDLNVLQVKLKMVLNGKRFLLVLDDMWNENLFDWDLLSAPLKAGECGSRIIVTTRNQGVVSIMRAIATHHLTQLSEECCQKLFEKYAFGTSNPDDHPILKSIGDEIANKCRGLPLAAKTLGALLHQESEAKQWHTILNSKIWDLPNDKNNILPALRLSYDHLHPHVKQCFAYCSMFSKGYEFKKEKLILMWMAEGFLQQQPKGEETMEEIGDKYFLELLSRSLFQESTHNEQHFVMHDLVNDLAQFASGEFCFKFEDGKPRGFPEKARHLAWLMNGLDVHEKFEALLDAKSIRTFLLLVSSETEEPPALRTIFKEKKLSKRLRVLSFPVKGIIELPDLGNLIHLRYLDLSNTSITNLTITRSLYNMQTLLLSRCFRLTGLPAEIRKLTNLRHLDVSRCTRITKLPPRFGELTNLRMLTDFWVGEAKDGESSKISELGRLSCLRGRLSISRLENVGNDQQASEANLKSKNYLCEIVFSWNTTNTSSDHSLKVLENLEPHTNLEKLTIEKYSGGKFPNWLSKVNFPNMVILHLTNCSFCKSLPSLGNLSSLQQLYISEMNRLELVNFGSHGDDGSGNLPFRSLKVLSFIRLPSWTTLTCDSEFPSLQELTIRDCEKLMGKFPDDAYLPCLQDLKLVNCPKLSIFSGEGMLIDSFSQIHISETLNEQLCSLTSLEELQITSLSISLLSNLPILGNGLSGLTTLKELHICNCKMPAELPNLQSLVITDCKELEEWDLYRMELPTCSETTNGCGGEKEFSKESWLPDTLTSLCINIRPRKQCGSHGMGSLIDYEITGKYNEELSFHEEWIPLRISSIQDLEKLVKRFQHLTSLKRLEIKCSMSIQA